MAGETAGKPPLFWALPTRTEAGSETGSAFLPAHSHTLGSTDPLTQYSQIQSD